MPLIDAKCQSETCGVIAELYRPLAMWPDTPPCPQCGSKTEQIHLPKGTVITAPAVVVYKTPDGDYRFPGDDNPRSHTAQQYAKLGYERVEVRGFENVRQLERRVNAKQATEIRQHVERQCQFREAGTAIRRSDVWHGMHHGYSIPEVDREHYERTGQVRLTGRMKTVHLTPQGEDLMRAAMRHNDEKPGPRAYEAGFHVEAYSYDRSNRDEARGRDGKRRRD